MARPGTVKKTSEDQEEYVAAAYGGKRSPSSGAADNDGGDVRAEFDLIECKAKGSPAHPLKNKPTLLQQFEKNAVDAHLEARSPVVALRYYWPDSPLANPKGWVDFAVRLLDEDAELRKDSTLYYELLDRNAV